MVPVSLIKNSKYLFIHKNVLMVALSWFAFSFNPIESLSAHLAVYDYYRKEISRIDARLIDGLEGTFVLMSIASKIQYGIQYSGDSFIDILNQF